MFSVREQIVKDLDLILEKEMGLPVEITHPNGLHQIYKKGSTTELLRGRVQYDMKEFNLQSGGTKVIPLSSITLAINSLDYPLSLFTENGLPSVYRFRVPAYPALNAPKIDIISSPDNQPNEGRSIGFITFYMQKAVQI
jgi:hypothetical protein